MAASLGLPPPPQIGKHGLLGSILPGLGMMQDEHRLALYQKSLELAQGLYQAALYRQQASTVTDPQERLALVTNPGKLGENLSANYAPQTGAAGTTTRYFGPGGQARFNTQTGISPGNNKPYAFTGNGFQSGASLGGVISQDDKTGALIDQGTGLTGQSVAIPTTLAPGEKAPGILPTMNFGGTPPPQIGSGQPGSPGYFPPGAQPPAQVGPLPNLAANAPRLTSGAPVGEQMTPNTVAAMTGDPGGFIGGLLGAPRVQITSGARSAARNAAVGGSPTSEHIPGNGFAYDFIPPRGMSNQAAIQRIVQSGVPFDQVIDEGNHVHFGVGPQMRGQVMAGSGGTAHLIGPAPDPAANAPRLGANVVPGAVVAGPSNAAQFRTVPGTQVPGGNPHSTYQVNPANGQVTEMKPEFGMDEVQSNRKAFYGSDQYKAAESNVAPLVGLTQTINSAAPGGIVDMAAIDTLAKSLNPTGVIRTGMVKILMDHTGLPAELQGQILNATGNGFLTPAVIRQIGRTTWSYAKAHVDAANDLAQKDAALAQQHGFQPQDVGESPPSLPPVPKWARDPIPAQPVPGRTYWGPRGPGVWNGKAFVMQ